MRKIVIFALVFVLWPFSVGAVETGPASEAAPAKISTGSFTNRVGLGARVSYFSPDSDTVMGTKIDPDSSTFVEGELGYYFIDWFSLELGVGYTKTDINLIDSGAGLHFGDLKQTPVLLTGRFHWWFTESKLNLYGGGGLGYYFNSFNSDALFTTTGSWADADNSFGFHLNGGFEFFLTNNVALNVDLKYIWTDIDYTLVGPGVVTPAFTYDEAAFIGGIGFKFYF